jgi:NAD(P)H-dependent FMN reductase
MTPPAPGTPVAARDHGPLDRTAPTVLVIVGSVRTGRLAPVVADWFLAEARRRNDLRLDVVDLADLTLPLTLDGTGDTDDFTARLHAADAVVVITPEYNHGYPGYLKIAIDSAFDEWRAKPVGFVSYGGSAGGERCVEQLRAVFAELEAVTVRETVALVHAESQFGTNGDVLRPERVNARAHAMLDKLLWWTARLGLRR